MDKKMENEMETGGILGFSELKLSYYIGETLLSTIYTRYGNLIEGISPYNGESNGQENGK